MKFILKYLGRSRIQAEPASTPQLAMAQLLLEMARADLRMGDMEMVTIRRHLAAAYGLDDEALDGLIASATNNVEKAVSLHRTVQVINGSLGVEDKNKLIRALWQVAYADGRLDPYEEALLRRLADLLFVSHDNFIREKLAVLER